MLGLGKESSGELMLTGTEFYLGKMKMFRIWKTMMAAQGSTKECYGDEIKNVGLHLGPDATTY